MHISVIIPTRNRVWGLAAILRSLWMCESGKNKVSYTIGCDSDDINTQNFYKAFRYEFPFAMYLNDGRPETLGGLVNSIALEVPADFYVALTDDALCTTPDWDEVLRKKAEEVPHGVFFIENSLSNQQALWVCCTEKWRAAMGGVMADHYPYWFDDLHMAEQWILATNTPCITSGMKCADKSGGTMRMRDLPFWVDFFVKTRKLRVMRGHDIARNLGLPEPKASVETARIIEEFIGVKDPETLKQLEKQGEASTPPDAGYLRAKARAEALLKQLEDTHA